MTYNVKTYKKCVFPKMGTKKVPRKKKSENSMTAKERSNMIYQKRKEFEKWFKGLNVDRKITLLIILWILDKIILFMMFMFLD